MSQTPSNANNFTHVTLTVWLCAVVLIGSVCLPSLIAFPPPPPLPTDSPEPKKRVPTAGQISLWVEQLGSRSFKKRQAATKHLSNAGRVAISAVQNVGMNTKIEAALRAVGVLKRIYTESRDGTTIDAAEAALLKLRTNANKSVARRAAEVLAANYPIRQARAVARIRELGGQVKFGYPFLVARNVDRPAAGFVSAVAIDGKWTGSKEDYAHINRLDSLGVLYLIKGHKIGEQRLAKLQQDLPDLKVQERGRSFLGVGTRLDTLGCRIGDVIPGSAAREGGILRDDIVVEIGGQAVSSPDDLIEIISNQEPGQKLKIVVLRTGDPFITTTLIEFRDDPDAFKPLLAIGLLNELRREIFVTLKPWNINN
jgi:hypothetical protein